MLCFVLRRAPARPSHVFKDVWLFLLLMRYILYGCPFFFTVGVGQMVLCNICSEAYLKRLTILGHVDTGYMVVNSFYLEIIDSFRSQSFISYGTNFPYALYLMFVGWKDWGIYSNVLDGPYNSSNQIAIILNAMI